MTTMNGKAKLKNSFLKAALLVSAGSMFVACTKGGSISSSSSTSTVTGLLSITQVYPTPAGSTWTPIVASNRTFIKGLSITIIGTCTRGISTIAVGEGGPNYPEAATCADDGTFTWNKTYVDATINHEADLSLTLTGMGIDGVTPVTGATASQLVRIDNQATQSPVVPVPVGVTAGSPNVYTGAGGQVTINGTCPLPVANAADPDAAAATVNGPGGVSLPVVANAFTYSATLVEGTNVNYDFTCEDLATNISGSTRMSITWTPSVDTRASVSTPGTVFTSGVSPNDLRIEASSTGINNAVSVAPSSVFEIDTFFNSIINQMRAN